MTKIINIKLSEKYDVYCGRAGKGLDGYFGNPFKELSREENIANFRTYFYDRIKKDQNIKKGLKN